MRGQPGFFVASVQPSAERVDEDQPRSMEAPNSFNDVPATRQ